MEGETNSSFSLSIELYKCCSGDHIIDFGLNKFEIVVDFIEKSLFH